MALWQGANSTLGPVRQAAAAAALQRAGFPRGLVVGQRSRHQGRDALVRGGLDRMPARRSGAGRTLTRRNVLALGAGVLALRPARRLAAIDAGAAAQPHQLTPAVALTH